MPIIYAYEITRQMCRDNPEARFVFGDNVAKRGLGGQARAMRGEPNAIGVPTKWAPTLFDGDFFRDDQDDAREEILWALDRVQLAAADGRLIVIPRDGIGTGLAEMPKRCPRLHALIVEEIRRLERVYGVGDASQLR